MEAEVVAGRISLYPRRMQQREESAFDSVGLPPIPASFYLAIPIPPREEPAEKKSFQFFRKRKRTTKKSDEAEVRRRRDFVQSFCVALLVNLLIALALLSVMIERPVDDGSGFLRTTMAVELETDSETSDSAAGAAAAAAGSVDTRESVANLSSASFETFALVPMNFETPVPSPVDTTATFSPTLAASDFAAIESASRREAREFVYGTGSHHAAGSGNGVGISQEVLAGLFPKAKLGDGSTTAVFLDMSGSMQEISGAVDRYMAANFKNDVTHHVLGCAMNGAKDPFQIAFQSVADGDRRTDYFFVCDLQDGETEGGIRSLRRVLLSGSTPKRLHVISFDKEPGFHLAGLLEFTNGTFTYIDPTL